MKSGAFSFLARLACLATLISATTAVHADTPLVRVGTQSACVAVMAATVTGIEGNAAAASTSVRDALVSFISGPSLRPIALDSRVRLQATEEAKEKGCSHFISLSVIRKAGGPSSLGRVVGQAAGTAAWTVPGGGSVGSAVARGASVGTIAALSDIVARTRAKDEIRLEWNVSPLTASGRSASGNEKAKATTDGEDILSPVLQRAAESIVELLISK